MAEAIEHYERREAELGAELMREIERQVMLRIIDQRWREHLYEMDYLQEGINLRAMGQKDPLVEWQREGFDMFGQMMDGIAQDFVRYVMHVQVVRRRPRPRRPVQNVQTFAADDVDASGAAGMQAAALAGGRRGRRGRWRSAGCRRPAAQEAPAMTAGREGRDGRRRPATRRARAGAARSSSSATGSRAHSCGTSPTT